MTTLLEAALCYAKSGLPVFPVKADKTPLTPHGFKDSTRDADTIHKWWAENPGAGIGVPMGSVSGLVVLDVDPRHGGDDSLEALLEEHGLLPRGPVAKTGGGGEHRYFAHPGGNVPPAHGFRPGLDLQGDGSYVVAPPSPHASGNTYEWVVPLVGGPRPPMLPGWLLRAAPAPAAPRQFGTDTDGRIPHGRRHDYLISLAASVVSRTPGITEAQALAIVKPAMYAASDDDRWPSRDRDIETAVRSALGKFGRPAPPSNSTRSDTGADPVHTPEAGSAGTPPGPSAPADRRVESPTTPPSDVLPGFPATGPLIGEPPPMWSAEGAWVHAGAVWRVLQEEHFCSLPDTREILRYERGVYNGFAEAFIESWVERQFQIRSASAKKNHRNEVVNAVRAATFVHRETFNRPGLVNLVNGVYDLGKGERRDHDPEKDRFTYRIPVAYDNDADPAPFLAWLAEVQPEPENRTLIQEMVGYCLSPGNELQTMFFHVGEGANGKSTFLSVLAELLGTASCSHEPPQTISENRFSVAELYGKLANIAADIPLQTLTKTDKLKSLTGGDYVRAEKKNKQPFKFVNGAKLVFSGQRLPAVKRIDGAFKRRVLVIEWPVFIPLERRDSFLVPRLCKSLPGILNWALEGRHRLWERGRFAPGETVRRATEDWLKRSASLEWFVQEEVVRDPDEWVLKDEFYARYAEFCEANGVPEAMTKQEVGAEIVRIVPGIRPHRPQVEGRREKAWRGLRFRYGGSSQSGLQGPGTSDGQKRLDAEGGGQRTDGDPDGPGGSTDGARPARPGQNASPKNSGTASGRNNEKLALEPGRAGRTTPDPEDVFAGRATRADGARAALERSDEGGVVAAPPDLEIDAAYADLIPILDAQGPGVWDRDVTRTRLRTAHSAGAVSGAFGRLMGLGKSYVGEDGREHYRPGGWPERLPFRGRE
ncbi:MAG: bifunctional DNA primase/polymerase [Acidimicrobiales bacterium]|nr:bifunctional DNA primase/polymerase [Acidimicrobiales bacterium]